MSIVRGERLTRDGYEFVGTPVEPFAVELDYDAALGLHNYIEQEFLPRMMRTYGPRRTVRNLTQTRDTVMVGSSFGRQHYSAPDLSVGFITVVKLDHQTDESWHLRVRDTNSRHDGTENKIARWYKIDVVADQLAQAMREVRVIRTRPEEAFRQLLDEELVVTPDRKIFETPLTNDDCVRLQERLQHVANRTVALWLS